MAFHQKSLVQIICNTANCLPPFLCRRGGEGGGKIADIARASIHPRHHEPPFRDPPARSIPRSWNGAASFRFLLHCLPAARDGEMGCNGAFERHPFHRLPRTRHRLPGSPGASPASTRREGTVMHSEAFPRPRGRCGTPLQLPEWRDGGQGGIRGRSRNGTVGVTLYSIHKPFLAAPKMNRVFQKWNGCGAI